ncbi:MAG: hypothetical protein ACR2IE_04010 [Candidatus Sumerlaeaceae bacterium]
MKISFLVSFFVIAAAVSNAVPRTGQFAAKVTNNTPAGGFQPDTGFDRETSRIVVLDGNSLTFTAYLKNGRTDPSNLFAIRFAQFSSTNTFLGDVEIHAGAAIPATYTAFTHTFTPAAGTARLNLSFRLGTGGSSAIIDDISVLDTTAGNVERLSNGGLETWPDPAPAAPTDWRFFSVGSASGTLEKVVATASAQDWALY